MAWNLLASFKDWFCFVVKTLKTSFGLPLKLLKLDKTHSDWMFINILIAKNMSLIFIKSFALEVSNLLNNCKLKSKERNM